MSVKFCCTYVYNVWKILFFCRNNNRQIMTLNINKVSHFSYIVLEPKLIACETKLTKIVYGKI